MQSIQSQKRIDEAKQSGNAATLILEQSNFEALQRRIEASWIDLAAKEVQIRQQTIDKKKQLEKAALDESIKKEQERLELLRQEKRIIEQTYEVDRRRIQGAFDKTEVQRRQELLANLDEQLKLDPDNERAQKERASLGATADPNSVMDQTKKSAVDFFNQIGTLAQSVGQLAIAPMVGMFEGMQTSIKGLLMGTMSWNQALVGVGRAILSSVISAFTQLIAKAILLFGLVTLLNVIAPGLGSALGSLMGVGSGVASGGGGKSFNPGASGNAGYAAGGYTGDGDRFSPAGIVHRGEYVMPQSAVSRIGVPNLEAMKAGAAPIGGGPNVHFAAFNSHQAAQQWAESRDGRTYLVDMMSQVVQEARA